MKQGLPTAGRSNFPNPRRKSCFFRNGWKRLSEALLPGLREENLRRKDREDAGERVVDAPQDLRVGLQPARKPIGGKNDDQVYRHADNDEIEAEKDQLAGDMRIAG